ncbi:MAG: MmgE/PrpD family protein [Chloroflexi bacterium]|nr:MmgE/PrpD family protein [Chloroflexota bacterium]
MDRTTEILSDYACSLTYEDLGSEVVHQVKRTLVDTLGCAAGGYSSEPAQIARKLAAATSSSTPARILGTEDSSSPDMAGFANGVMIRFLDCNDSYFSPGGGHPSDMIAAPLALAGVTNSDGRAVITAIVLAYEVFGRLSDQVVTTDLGWDQGMFSAIGAACAAGKVLGLNRGQMGHAISLVVAPNLPLGVTRTGELPMWKGCATASATRAAIFAALLAGQGMTGPSEPFEGKRGLWEQAVGRQVQLGAMGGGNEPFRITDSFFKAYPAQIHTQAPTGLALELQPLVSSKEIESIRIHAYRSACSTPATEPTKWDPKTRESADHSIPYMVAVAFLDGGVSPASFTSQKISDPGIRELISKITIEENEEYTGKYPGEYNIRMEVSDRSGKTHAAHTSFPKGHQNNPLSDEELEAKFRGLSSGVWSDGQSAAALELIWALEDLTSLDELMDGLVV